MNIFRYNDYRDILVAKIKISKDIGEDWTFSSLAEAICVQKAYITRVLKKDGHLNSDQLYLACEYLGFNPEETQYLFLLLELGRSVINLRKKELQKQINDIQGQHRDTKKYLKAEMINPLSLDEFSQYYLDPLAPLIHTFLSIPSFSKNIKLISQRLNISEKRLKTTLKSLEDLKIVKWNSVAQCYQILRDHMQLVKESPLNLPYQVFQRTNAIQKIQTKNSDERFVFSVAFSGNEQTRSDIHDEFLKFLRKTEALVKEATPSEIYQMNFDLFGWN